MTMVSPQTKWYLLGKGFILIKPDGEDNYYHAGNCPAFSIKPSADVLEHFSSMEGIAEKDDTVIRQKSGEVKMTLEEYTARNISLLMLGDVDEDDYGVETIELFSATSKTCSIIFYATNQKGPRWKVTLPKVTFNPSNELQLIGTEYGKMELTGSWETSDGSFGQMVRRPAYLEAAPENALVPQISGILKEGEELEGFVGGWIDASSYAYQWKANGVNIGGATSSKYTLTSGEIGDTITLQVTATNTVGSTTATSLATTAVVAAES